MAARAQGVHHGAGPAMLPTPTKRARSSRDGPAVDIPVTVRPAGSPLESAPSTPAFADAGASALFVRSRGREYEGTADHRITAEVVRAVDSRSIASATS